MEAGLAKIGEREWYFLVPRDRKQTNRGRPNRTTERGFWKATGSDRPIRSAADPKRLIGLKKTLVYYLGRAPRGSKTDWVMNEYRLPDDAPSSSSQTPKDIVLCKIYRKATPMRELEQRAAMAEGTRAAQGSASVSAVDTVSSGDWEVKEEEEVQVKEAEVSTSSASFRSVSLPEIEVPKHSSLEWMQDPLLTQLRSPWMDQWSPYANLLNF